MFIGECHFVRRRVSETEESEISSGKWNDSTVLSVFWLAVFFVVTSVIIVLRRRKQNAEFYDSGLRYSSKTLLFDIGTTTTGSRSTTKYSPINLETDSFEQNHNNHVNNELVESDEEDEDEVDSLYGGDRRNTTEGVPLVLKT
jgi:hypothetical protein